MSTADKPTFAELWKKLGDVPVAIGLRQQGHMPTIEAMIAEQKTWEEIGKAIGWDGKTAEQWYAVEAAIECAALRAENERLKQERELIAEANIRRITQLGLSYDEDKREWVNQRSASAAATVRELREALKKYVNCPHAALPGYINCECAQNAERALLRAEKGESNGL